MRSVWPAGIVCRSPRPRPVAAIAVTILNEEPGGYKTTIPVAVSQGELIRFRETMIQANVELPIGVAQDWLGQVVDCRPREVRQRKEVENMLCHRGDSRARNLVTGKRHAREWIPNNRARARQIAPTFGRSGHASQTALSGPFKECVGIRK